MTQGTPPGTAGSRHLTAPIRAHCTHTAPSGRQDGARPRLLLGIQVYFPASSGFTRKMISVPSIRIRTLSFRSLREKRGEKSYRRSME